MAGCGRVWELFQRVTGDAMPSRSHRQARPRVCINLNRHLHVQVLVSLHRSVSLTFTAIEDANVGMWLAGMNITRHNWEGVMLTAGWTCCFSRTQDKYAPCAGRVPPPHAGQWRAS